MSRLIDPTEVADALVEELDIPESYYRKALARARTLEECYFAPTRKLPHTNQRFTLKVHFVTAP